MRLMSIDLPQAVPNERCLRCDVCCRFPEKESPLRPYFTEAEIARAVAHGVPAAAFPDVSGGRITLIPHPQGEGYICPAFDAGTNGCTIYEVRPLDCRLYPFAVMRPPRGEGVLLGWDRLCPYLREEAEPMAPVMLSADVAARLQEADQRGILVNHPGLIGGFQEMVWVLEPLEPTWRAAAPVTPEPGTRLEPVDVAAEGAWERLVSFLARSVDPDLSARHAATLMMWRPLMTFHWMTLKRGLALLAEQGGVYFAPVPPAADSAADFVGACVELLRHLEALNRRAAPSRIERLGEAQCRPLEAAGLRCRAQGEEYLYDRRALAELRGDDYKSQRWNCNQAERRFRPSYKPYRPEDATGCLRLFAAWRRLKEPAPWADSYPAALLADSFYAHWQALTHAQAWGLTVRVVRVEGAIAAYAVGAPLSDDAMVVLHEVADPRRPGLGPWLFREWCREFTDYSVINAMDDSDLKALRAAKTRYRPMRMVTMYQATM